MFDTITATLQPMLVEYLLLLTLAGAGWLMRRLPERMRMDIEARHREALHRALDTGVGLAVAAVRRTPQAAALDIAVAEIAGYVHRSVPGALRQLAPSQAQLEQMARAKLQQHLDALIGRDRLTEALNRVPGISAQKP